jgi:hypothetical protein
MAIAPPMSSRLTPMHSRIAISATMSVLKLSM